ncbi:MAG: beta-lactamase family protein [Acidimicrobiales bacterium]|nr:beta-lactamase family protein [Acidimicrobiales bacterium]
MSIRPNRLSDGRLSRWCGAVTAMAVLSLVAAACSTSGAASGSPPATPAPAASVQNDHVTSIVRAEMAQQNLRGVIVEITKGGTVVSRQAFGVSLTGEPATPDMHFRNGAVAFEYLTTLLLQYVDEHKVSLDDTIQRWEPTLPEANQVTLKMLANQTTGYPDFETDSAWTAAFYADPTQSWSYPSRLAYAFRRPPEFAPGTNWSYSHTNFMILGDILAKIGGQPLDVLLSQKVLQPMGLTSTVFSTTGSIPTPTLHSYSSERRVALGIPSGAPFYEEATYWNSDWGVPVGANETTTVDDLIRTAQAVGTGKLVSKASYTAMTAPNLLGFGHKDPACGSSCFTQIPAYNFGLGVVRQGSWLTQDPELGGYSATEAYLPSQKIAIATATTYAPGAFDDQGNYSNASDVIFHALAAYMAPSDAVPPPP